MRMRKKEESTDKSGEDQDYSVPCPWPKEDPPRKRLLLTEGNSSALSILKHHPCSWGDFGSPNGMLVPVKILEQSERNILMQRSENIFVLLYILLSRRLVLDPVAGSQGCGRRCLDSHHPLP